METFKPIPEYNGIYEVSDKGIIRTDKDKITYIKGRSVRHWKQRIMKAKIDKKGYKRVTLWKNGKGKDFLVHRLVATAFIPNPKKYYVQLIKGDCYSYLNITSDGGAELDNKFEFGGWKTKFTREEVVAINPNLVSFMEEVEK